MSLLYSVIQSIEILINSLEPTDVVVGVRNYVHIERPLELVPLVIIDSIRSLFFVARPREVRAIRTSQDTADG
jgi:hypothetical protein